MSALGSMPVKSEPSAYVLDSFALLAYLGAEPGEPQVQDILQQAARKSVGVFLSIINYWTFDNSGVEPLGGPYLVVTTG